MVKFLFSLFSQLPLVVLHAVGAALGWLTYGLSGVYRKRFRANVAQAGYSLAQVGAAAAQAGKMAAELPRLWLGAPVPMRFEGAELVDAAHAAGKGLLLLTPHLGCFEVTAQAYAQCYLPQGKPITVLFRPPRKAWLDAVVSQSRDRPGLRAVPTTLAGVKAMLKALKSGQTVGLLPDQVPPQGLGVWVPFFGRDAYTMTLPARLQQMTGASVLLTWGERLPGGQGYCVHYSPLPQALSDNLQAATAQINQAMQELIARCPQQYLWGYARYKQPRQDGPATAPAQGREA